MSIKHIKQKIIIAVAVSIIAAAIAILTTRQTDAPTPQVAPSLATKPAPAPEVPAAPSIDDPASLSVVVNKKRPLPASYAPASLTNIGNGQQLQSEAAGQVSVLVAAAAQDGVSLKSISGYRSFDRQQSLYASYVAQDGQQNADTYSARPGHSEHQTGLGVDLGNASGACDLDACFGNTTGGTWMALHAHEYGFTIRYPSNKTAITGYQYEPWHLRYVGKDLAQKLYDKKQTMEEYFELPAAPSY